MIFFNEVNVSVKKVTKQIIIVNPIIIVLGADVKALKNGSK